MGKWLFRHIKFTSKDVENSKIIAINGVAKLYGMTGFRIGWVVAQRKLVEIMTNIQSQTTTCVSPVMQAAAEGALTGIQSNVEALRLSDAEQPGHPDAGVALIYRCALL